MANADTNTLFMKGRILYCETPHENKVKKLDFFYIANMLAIFGVDVILTADIHIGIN